MSKRIRRFGSPARAFSRGTPIIYADYGLAAVKNPCRSFGFPLLST
jgi:hypothetical protein